MAVTPNLYLNDAGLQKAAEFLLRSANTRIKERIITSIAASSYSDADRVIAASAILGLIGNIGNYDSMDGTGNTVLDKVAALRDVIGTSSDTAQDDTVYGEIAEVRALISSLTHLTYEVVEGDIQTEVPMSQAKEDVIYLQHDAPSYAVGNDGYLLNELGTHAQYDDSGTVYEAWKDPSDGKIYKMVAGVKGAELSSNDPIFNEVAMVEDTTYNLYVCQLTKDGSGTVTAIEWICVGDTSIELSNYWSKTDADVNALKNLILGNITDATIEAKVQAAFDATDPFESGTTPYVPASWVTP